jgi:hypothetical protein
LESFIVSGVTNPERIRRRQIGHDINGPKRKPRPLITAAPKIAAAPTGGPIPYKPQLIAVPDNARPVALADLGQRQCRWPLDDPGPGEMARTLFCAAPAEGIYCACHSRVAFNPIPSKGPRSADELARSLRKYA